MLFQLQYSQWVACSLARTWDFFSNPNNLAKITPASFNFNIIRPVPNKIYPGLLIEYSVSPFLGLPLTWISEITQIQDGKFFIDEQKLGPYRLWHHQHWFNCKDGGTEILDTVHYAVGLPLIDRLLNPLIIRPRIEKIFAYRRDKIAGLFEAEEHRSRR